MKTTKYIQTFLLAAAAFTFVTATPGQDEKPVEGHPPGDQRPAVNQPRDGRHNALRQLGLSPEQIQQIRRLNMERKPLMEEAQKRFREANRSLDEAIYADEVNEGDVQARLKEVHLAQAEVSKIRFMNELAVRRILTPEQLVHFRELRRRFEQARDNFQNQRPINRERPLNRPPPGNQFKRFQDSQQPIRRVIRQDQQRPSN